MHLLTVLLSTCLVLGASSKPVTLSCNNHCSAVFLLCDQQSASMKETFNCIKVEWSCKTKCAEHMLKAAEMKDRKRAALHYDSFHFDVKKM